jgi:2-oxoisovalerate dehydrogenase E1 component alpha subunit
MVAEKRLRKTASSDGKAKPSTRRAPARTVHSDIDDERLVWMYRTMLLARKLADRMMILNRQGRSAFAITGQGQEAAQVGAAVALKPGFDWLLPYYRDLGMLLAFGMTSRQAMLDALARKDALASGGMQMPTHWSWREKRVISGSSPVMTQALHACGVALASKLHGDKEVALTSFGEGSTSQGDFHEALNFAAIHKLPVVFYCENNGYAITEIQAKEMAVPNVADRAAAYGIRGQVVDGNDVLAVYQTVRWAVEECRAGRGPALIEAKTYRLAPHSSADDDRRYRSRKELEEWLSRDPIDRFRQVLLDEKAADEAEFEEIAASVDAEVKDALDWAQEQPFATPDEALQHVYAAEAVSVQPSAIT